MIEALKTITDQIIQIPDDVGAQVQYLLDLSNIKWAVSELLPEAKAKYNERLAVVSELYLTSPAYKDVSTSTLNNLIKSKLAQEQKVVDTLDRINATINLQSQNLRTIISFKKSQ